MVATANNTIADLEAVNRQIERLRTQARADRERFAATRKLLNAAMGRRADLTAHHDDRFLENMEDADYAAAVEDLIREIPIGPRAAAPDFDTDDAFAEQIVRESTQDVADQLAAARAQDPDCAAAPPTQTELAAARETANICQSCGKVFHAAISIDHCAACLATAFDRAYAPDDDVAEHDANGDA